MKIATLTMNPSIDIHLTVDELQPSRKLRSRLSHRDPGGGGINVGRVIRALGGEALTLFPAGGPSGASLQQLLAEADVPVSVQEIAGMSRENFTVLEQETEREYRFVLPGPELSRDEWQACLDLLAAIEPQPEYLVASGSLPPGVPDDFYARVAAWARENSVRLVLDTSGPALPAALEEGVYLVKPNRRELEDLSGQRMARSEEEEALSRELIERGKAEVVALTLGADGAVLTSADGSRRVAVPDVEVKSSVGAGDSFLAAMVCGLVRGMPLQRAFCYGIAAGTAALLTPGTELCRKEDVERLFRKICEER